MSRCGCGQSIRWVVTAAGKRMPLDPLPADDGTVRVTPGPDGPEAVVLGPLEVALARGAGEELWRTHWATCPQADRYRADGVIGGAS